MLIIIIIIIIVIIFIFLHVCVCGTFAAREIDGAVAATAAHRSDLG